MRDDTTLQYVRDCCENESFSYAFTDYSNYENVKDKKFHRLRLAYLEAGKALAKYLGVEIGG